jgi:hypothetical protein
MEKASNTGWLLLAGLAALVIGGSLAANHKTTPAGNDKSNAGDSTVKIIGGEITFN